MTPQELSTLIWDNPQILNTCQDILFILSWVGVALTIVIIISKLTKGGR